MKINMEYLHYQLTPTEKIMWSGKHTDQYIREEYKPPMHSFNVATWYVQGKYGSSINIQIVYTATTQIDFVRSVTIMTLPHFISN